MGNNASSGGCCAWDGKNAGKSIKDEDLGPAIEKK